MLLIFGGLPGTGKSTIARRQAWREVATENAIGIYLGQRSGDRTARLFKGRNAHSLFNISIGKHRYQSNNFFS